MPKTLVSINFVVDGIPEESLGQFVSALDSSIQEAVAESLDKAGSFAFTVEDRIEWYGGAVTVKRSLRDVAEA